ncbi:MAG: radical SAM family heme chaperone HemW [Lachnospiraceae bacterium]|nr:radical SAM family heme chaperone HemW [Lachnospiraceae bacterium]
MTEPLGIYIHIPFCVRKCRYCDFLSFSAPDSLKEAYAEALCREIRAAAELYQRPVDTVFIGGGTPSVLPYSVFRSMIDALREAFRILPDAEVTVEMNPGAGWSAEELNDLLGGTDRSGYGAPAVSRISLGLQSVHDDELKRLGRIHDFRTFLNTYEKLRAAGASDINFDLMFGIPGQTGERWRETLRTAVSLAPEHLSAYSLILEEGTPFFEEWKKGTLLLPDEESERNMAYEAAEYLGNAGYRRYEISNYSRPGHASRHNIRYWQRKEYYGAGIGAASFLGHTRWKNTSEMKKYLAVWGGETERTGPECMDACREDTEHLTKKQEMEEFMFLGLRMTEGISAAAFEEEFGVPLREEYGPVLEKYLGEKMLGEKDGRIYLTDRGTDVSNVIMSGFLHDD